MSHLARQLRAAGFEATSLETLFHIDDRVLYGLAVSGAEALSVMDSLRQSAVGTPQWPLLMGSRAEAAEQFRQAGLYESMPLAEILEASTRIDVRTWTALQAEMDPTSFVEIRSAPSALHVTPSHLSEPHHTLSLAKKSISGKPLPQVIIALVPTDTPAEAPALLRFGGRNACPAPSFHVAFARRWSRTCRAQIVGLTSNVIEMSVGSPPATLAAARALAIEHVAYCRDLITGFPHQDLDTVAAKLINAPLWHFHWV